MSSAGMATVELSSLLLKQQQQQQQQQQQPPVYQDDMNAEYLQQRTGAMPLSASTSASSTSTSTSSASSAEAAALTGDCSVTSFSDPLSHFTDFFGVALKDEEHQRLDQILMDDALSPFATDPLLSAGSPPVRPACPLPAPDSEDGSRRSSFSSAEGDEEL
ncbi:hypothetical protein NHX12_020872 [Muraenolepis orangiensis]|uniref:MiT/TFE transcription factors C-terminal domain-containing protein n=1 Tax=Muraenolepis orangiensis TaxID=630683 RepID=A0A9Q0ESS6_9TELE|nr:hypothetical protein NHX12_020872 [Muraenolepis orangiensis]